MSDCENLIGTRWKRATPWDERRGPYNGYEVPAVTNTAHPHERHPPQVVYRGDNGHVWSLPLADWPGKLVPEGSALVEKENPSRE